MSRFGGEGPPRETWMRALEGVEREVRSCGVGGGRRVYFASNLLFRLQLDLGPATSCFPLKNN